MVVNEVTSSVQAKGTKTVVAAAVATMIAGVAGATEIPAVPTDGAYVITVHQSKTDEAGENKAGVKFENGAIVATNLKAQNVFKVISDGTGTAGKTTPNTFINTSIVQKAYTFDKELWVVVEGGHDDADTSNNGSRAHGLYASGEGNDIVNTGKVYVDVDAKAVPWVSTAMVADNGAVATNKGQIIVKNAVGMKVGTTGTGSQIINAANGNIHVIGKARGFELEARKGNTDVAENWGHITVEGKDAVGAFVNQMGAKFTNAGVIDAAEGLAIFLGKGTVELAKDSHTNGTTMVAGGTLNALEGSNVNGLVKMTGGTLTSVGNIVAADSSAILIEGNTPVYNEEANDFDTVVAQTASVALNDKSVTTGNIVVKNVTASKTKGEDTKNKTSEVTANITIHEGAVFTGNLDLSGTTHNIYGSSTTKKFGVVDGSIFAKAGTTILDKNLKAKALNISAGATTVVNATSGNVVVGDLDIAPKVEKPATAAGILNVNGALEVSGKGVNAGTIGGTGALTVSGEFDNSNGTLSVTTLKINEGGVLSTKVTDSSLSSQHITINKGGVLNLAALNSNEATSFDYNSTTNKKFDGTVLTDDAKKVKDQLLILTDVKLNGGVVKSGDADVKKIKLGVAADSTITTKAGSLTIESGEYALDAVHFGSATGSTLTIAGGDLTVDSLYNENGTTNVNKGTLSITSYLRTAGASSLTVGSEGTLNLTADSIRLTEATTGRAVFGHVYDDHTDLKFKGLTNNGMVNLTGLEGKELSKTFLDDINANLGGNGLINLGNVTQKDLKALDDGSYDYTKLAHGIVTDTLSQATVSNVAAGTAVKGSFGKVVMKPGDSTMTVGTALMLNGSGNLVTYEKTTGSGTTATKTIELATIDLNGQTLVTTGGTADAPAVLGEVKDNSTSGTKGNLKVASGALEVKGDVALNALTVNGALTMTEKAAIPATATAAAVPAKAYNLNATDVNVGTDGALNVQGLVTTTTAKVLGQANIGELSATGSVAVGDKDNAGKLTVNKLTKGHVFADPAWDVAGDKHSEVVVADSVATGATVEAGQNSVAVIGTKSADVAYAALAKSGMKLAKAVEGVDNTVNSAIYVTTKAAEVDPITGNLVYNQISGNLLANNNTTATVYAPGTIITDAVTIANDSMLIVDMTNFDKSGETAVFKGAVTLGNDADLYLDNVLFGDAVKLSSSQPNLNEDNTAFVGDLLMKLEGVEDATGTTITAHKIVLRTAGDLADEGLDGVVGLQAAQSMFANRANLGDSTSARFNNWLYTSSNGIQSATELKTIARDVASIGATAGMASVTVDALSAFNDTVAARTSILAPNAEGTTVWADVNGGKYEAKRLFNGAGYSSDIYAGVLGVDTTLACGAKIGAALTIGSGDTDSKNTSAVTSMDSDFFGLSVYTSQKFADIANVAVDFGYMQGSNDVDVNAYNLGKFSADSDAFTLGVRGELLTKAGSFNIVPHAGLRWTRVSVDSFEAGYTTDIDTMNVFQLPVGVTVSGDFETHGWTLAPAFDLSFVPAFGDKDADMTLGVTGATVTDKLGVQVIDSNPVQATLGLDAVNGAWAFGLNYKLGAGSEGRVNNTFNANVRYTF